MESQWGHTPKFSWQSQLTRSRRHRRVYPIASEWHPLLSAPHSQTFDFCSKRQPADENVLLSSRSSCAPPRKAVFLFKDIKALNNNVLCAKAVLSSDWRGCGSTSLECHIFKICKIEVQGSGFFTFWDAWSLPLNTLGTQYQDLLRGSCSKNWISFLSPFCYSSVCFDI